MSRAAHRFYDNEDVFYQFIKLCSKPVIQKLMMVEQSGFTFDQCVKEMYRKVKYADIVNMTRDSVSRSLVIGIDDTDIFKERKIQYLDTVTTVEADLEEENHYLNLHRRDEPCTPTGAHFLRLRCPNLRIITRHNAGALGQ
jgi:hypothetical protein